jgi:hypothetical protein
MYFKDTEYEVVDWIYLALGEPVTGCSEHSNLP